MYAVIKTGGKQYRVSEGETLRIEKIVAEVGSDVEFDQVLLVGGERGTRIGTPMVEGSKVSASVTAHGRAKKVKIVKFRRRKHHLKRMGHRQAYTDVRITAIQAG